MINKPLVITLAMVASLLAAEPSLAHKANNPETSYRRHSMKAATGHEKALHLLLEPTHRAPFADQADKHISALLALFQSMPSLFPRQGNYQNSDARPVIWQQWERFIGLIERGKQALQAMQTDRDPAQRHQALKQLHSACVDCHETYRD